MASSLSSGMPDDSTSLSPELPDELVHEILFRLPPDKPACLALLSKPWRRLLSDPAFHRRYRQFHRKPPMLGFLYELMRKSPPTAMSLLQGHAPPPIPDHSLAGFRVLDSRHGRVLVDEGDGPRLGLVVWDPMTGLRSLVSVDDDNGCLIHLGTAVMCAMDGCDHATCHDGHFRVVFVGVDNDDRANARVYSSETGEWEWGTPTSELQLVEDCYLCAMSSQLVADNLHFLMTYQGCRILKYDLGTHRFSMIDLPAGVTGYDRGTTLMAAEDGGLGISHLDKLMLYMWSRQSGVAAAWTQHRVIDLKSFLPIGNPSIKVELIGSIEGADMVFATTALGLYIIDLKLLRSKKLRDRLDIEEIFPFMSFYSPLGQ